ncbi:GGDEF domain-containing protein (plasmid) [Aquamicrobium terrae]
MTNGVIAAQILAIIISIILEREQLPSRWGLVFAYGAVAASSLLRVVQGLFLDRGMDNLLPADIFLDLNLIAATIHISASGAFSLSLAYERSVASLRETALRDPLTGLYNRWSIQDLPELIKRAGASKEAALVLLDIDHFKAVNDNHGHAAGDQAIKRCAQLIRRVFQKDDLIARIGGEEFIILLPGKNIRHASRLAETLRKAIEDEPMLFQGKDIRLTASFGISHGSLNTHSFTHLLEKADACLYQAKNAGRNRIVVDPERTA